MSHDRRLLESICERLWVVEAGSGEAPGRVVAFEGGYRAWREAVSEGWTVEAELARAGRGRGLPGSDGAGSRQGGASARGGPAVTTRERQVAAGGPRDVGAPPVPERRRTAQRQPPLSKDAYRRQMQRVEEDLTRLGLRKSQLELRLADGAVQTNFVELRRLSSELADVDGALAQAEDAWLALSERAPR